MAEQLVRKPHMVVKETLDDAWRTYLDNLDKALGVIEQQVREAKEVRDICTDEWCEATEHAIEELNDQVTHIHEPWFTTKEDSQRIKAMKKRLREIFYEYKKTAEETQVG
jgi:hypothetical protein